MDPSIYQHLEEAVQFINKKNTDIKQKKIIIETLTQDLIRLDSWNPSPERKELCSALDNVITQLESSEKTHILLSSIQLTIREDYLPAGGNSLRALKGAFD